MPNMIKVLDCEDLGKNKETVTRLYRDSVWRGTSMCLKRAFKDYFYD